jgi:TetR/AcrR family transcriptional regulator, copper-responsive repressor
MSKQFARDTVLLKAISVFWEKGFAESTWPELEKATGESRSRLHAEFKNKEQMYLQSLRYYLDTRGGYDILAAEPKGWSNIRTFLEIGQTCYSGRRGCFSVNSFREMLLLPPQAVEIVNNNNARLKKLLIENIKAELPAVTNAGLLADLVLTFLAGLCIEQNSSGLDAHLKTKVDRFLQFLAEAS